MRRLVLAGVLVAACSSKAHRPAVDAPPVAGAPTNSPTLPPGLFPHVDSAKSPAELEGKHVDGPPPDVLPPGVFPHRPAVDPPPGERARAGRPAAPSPAR